jgi:aspartokinase/homoserine dehydrogenase 1
MKIRSLDSEGIFPSNQSFRHQSIDATVKKTEPLSGFILHESNFELCINELTAHGVQIRSLVWSERQKNYLLQVRFEDHIRTKQIIDKLKNNQFRTINLAVWGAGKVGSALVDIILKSPEKWLSDQGVIINIFAVANSKRLLLNKNGLSKNWRHKLKKGVASDSSKDLLLAYSKHFELENLIFVDTTANQELTTFYPEIIRGGYHVVAANKIANTSSIKAYDALYDALSETGKSFRFETNVGAALPVIQTVNQILKSGDQINRIRGTFSGSLNFILSELRNTKTSFSRGIQLAMKKGFTEPDPREDLSGMDVTRKLLVLARQLGLRIEMEDIDLRPLIDAKFGNLNLTDFLEKVGELDLYYSELFSNVEEGKTYVYAADIILESSVVKHISVGLQEISTDTVLANLNGTDTGFEIFTEAYGDRPVCISGAGAGIELTARGVLSDIFALV